MATIATQLNSGSGFASGEVVTATKLNSLVNTATVTGIVNADIDAAAAIAASKLALTGAITDTQLATGAVTGAAGGGKIAASAITGQTTIADALADADEFFVHDASASALRKVAWSAMKSTASITLDTVKNSTSGSTVDFTGIPSTAKRVTVMFDGVSLSGTDAILVQIGDSGGVETTGYVGGGARIGTSASFPATSTSGFTFNGPATAAYLASGMLVISNMTGNTWVASGSLGLDNAANFLLSAGSKTLSGVLDRVRVTASGSNTFDAGKINISYE